MSGDVQPRKRKDKKRKKDDVALEEHRGTAATFREGEMQMHSQHDHGTGGHWCAKIIFFSLLAVLVTLIGLIILENRGLTELEANAVESQYSGLLDGWIEDTPDDDHHDEHTLDLIHHPDNEDIDEHESEDIQEFDDDDDAHDDDDEHDEEDNDEVEEDEDGSDDDGGDEDGDDEDDEENMSQEANDEDEVENVSKEENDDDDDGNQEKDDDEGYDDFDSNEDEDDEIEKLNIETTENRYAKPDGGEDDDDDDDNDDDDDDNDKDDDGDNDNDEDDDNDDDDNEDDNDGPGVIEGNDDGDDDNDSNEILDQDDDGNDAQSYENDDDDEENSNENQDDEDDDEHEDDHEEEAEEEIEKIEKEVSDQEEPESAEIVPDIIIAEKEEDTSVEVVSPDEEYEVDDKEFLEVGDIDEPAVERIEAPPPGKPFAEIEDEVSTETPALDTIAEEEEYEKQQEELRQQEAQSSQIWLKLAVGGALLAATHAVLRRATAPRDAPENEQDEHASREETPLTDRRMTLIPDESSKVIPPQSSQPKIEEEVVQKVASAVKADAVQKQESEEVEDDEVLEEEVEEDQGVQVTKNDDKNKELYSDDDEIEVDEEVDDEEEIEEPKVVPKPILKVESAKKIPEPEPEEDPDDVEIIDDEHIEEEMEEEVEDEEEISDVDDAELLSRLEAKYGRLPEPDRPGQRQKDGGNSLEDLWPGEPSDSYWKEQLDKAEQELRQGAFVACAERVSALGSSGRARWLRARALDLLAEERRDNRVLGQAIAAYKKLLEMNEKLSDKKLLEVALRTIDRIQFRGAYINAEPIYRLLIRRFPNDVTYRNNLTISFLMANRADLASEVLKETLRLWPDDRMALAHYGFILKTEQNKLEEAVTYFQRALAGDAGAANEPRFYYHLGDALLMLGRKEEAHEVHKRGTELGHFLSPSQRSLYNVPRLKSKPWWDVWSTPYAGLARELEASWREILREGEAAQSLYEKEKEGLREKGEWSQLDLFVRGREVAGRCARAPVTCRIVKREPAAQCRRGQVKFSLMSGGSHVRAHVGPTNCRLRMHLALANTEHTYIRVDQEIRQWQVGKVLMFDDSFEHEVWHNGTRDRLVLIVDVWHPDLTPAERRTLPAI